MNFKQNHIKMSTPEEFSALKSRIRGKFRDSVHHLSARCLQKAATWTSEQILGMDDTDDQRSDFMQRCDPYRGIPMRHIDSLMMARLLLAGGEYQRCAYFVRSRQIGSFDSKDQGERKAARMGLFLSSYARYLAGEKLKEQLSTEVAAEGDKAEVVLNADGTPVSPKPARKGKAAPATETERRYASKNCNLQSLCDDLSAHYSEGHMRGDGFLLYIYAVVARDLRRQQGLPVSTVLSSVAQSEHSIMDCTGGGVGALSGGSAGGAVSARQLFLESLHEYPWNW